MNIEQTSTRYKNKKKHIQTVCRGEGYYLFGLEAEKLENFELF
jgi:hypothetical protein